MNHSVRCAAAAYSYAESAVHSFYICAAYMRPDDYILRRIP